MTITTIAKLRASNVALLLLTFFIVSCGGGSSTRQSLADSIGTGAGGSNNAGDGESMLIGYFIDSGVTGLSYRVFLPDGNVVDGITGPNGEYEYQSGREVEFSLGDVVLGRTEGAPVVTPFSFTESALSDDFPINTARMLLTLDSDGDPSNGIQISDQARSSFEGLSSSLANMLHEIGSVFDDYFTNLVSVRLPAYSNQIVSAQGATVHMADSLDDIDYQINLTGTQWQTEFQPQFLQYWNESSQSWAHLQSCTLTDYGIYSVDDYDANSVFTTAQQGFVWMPQCASDGQQVYSGARGYDADTLCGYKFFENPVSDLRVCTYADLNAKKAYEDSQGNRFTRYISHTPFSGKVYSTFFIEYDDDGITYRENWTSIATRVQQ